MHRSLSILALAATALHAGLARADSSETAKWSTVGGWQIRVDPSLGYGCFAVQSYEDGTVIRVGFNLSTRTIYFTVGNKAWQSLEEGKVYRMRFVFDGVTGKLDVRAVAAALPEVTDLEIVEEPVEDDDLDDTAETEDEEVVAA